MTSFVFNGLRVTVHAAPTTPLLYVLRNDLEANGPKFGCGIGLCGACMVLVDGAATQSCVTSLESVQDRTVTTLEGLGTPENIHPVQQGFLAAQAAQCGYCTNGFIITATSLLAQKPDASDAEIRDAFRACLCRCGTHARVIKAVKLAQAMRGN
jgi:nicotinate dehydrogenase subunit A